MHKAPVHPDDNCLVRFIAHHCTLHDTLWHISSLFAYVRLRLCAAALIGHHCFDTRNIAPDFAHARCIFQLANGLLGISIEGQHRFDIESTWREPDGLIKAKVVFHDAPQVAPLPDDQVGLAEVLTGLLRHPQIKQLNLQADPSDAWRVCWQLAQLLPLDEAIKYELLGIVSVDQLLDKMDKLLKEISGEES